MNIFNKNKHFNSLILDFFDSATDDVKTIHHTIHCQGALPLGGKTVDRFLMVTFMYLLFMWECALQKQYFPKYVNEVCTTIQSTVHEIARRTNYPISKAEEAYLWIRKRLNDIAEDARKTNLDSDFLYQTIAVHYVSVAVPKDFNPVSTEVYNFIGNIFYKAMNYYNVET